MMTTLFRHEPKTDDELDRLSAEISIPRSVGTASVGNLSA
jgi:hypothetical protein